MWQQQKKHDRRNRITTRKEGHKRVNLCVFPLGESKLPQNRRQQVFANGTLIINNVDRGSDEGSYRCVAENKEGESAFRDVGVKVLGESIFQSGSYWGGLKGQPNLDFELKSLFVFK